MPVNFICNEIKSHPNTEWISHSVPFHSSPSAWWPQRATYHPLHTHRKRTSAFNQSVKLLPHRASLIAYLDWKQYLTFSGRGTWEQGYCGSWQSKMNVVVCVGDVLLWSQSWEGHHCSSEGPVPEDTTVIRGTERLEHVQHYEVGSRKNWPVCLSCMELCINTHTHHS